MAADVTLLAMSNSPENLRIMRLRTWLDLFEDDGVCIEDGENYRWLSGTEYFALDQLAEITAMSSGNQRNLFDREFYGREDRSWDHQQIGPWSTLKASLYSDGERWLPGPTAAVHGIWMRGGVVTPGTVAKTMVAYNQPDQSHYRSWSRRTNLYGTRRISKLGSNRGKRCLWPGTVRHAHRRVPPARLVRRWLVSHLGDLVWAESW